MKKKITIIAMVLALIALFAVPSFAAQDDSDAQLDHVTDSAGILSMDQVLSLEASATAVSVAHGCSVYIVTVDDYQRYTDYDEDVTDCAADIFDDYDLGFGEDRNGILLLLSMDDRDYALIAHGGKANSAFTDYGKYVLADEFLDDFADNEWYEGFDDYITTSGDFLALYEAGTPVDTNPEEYDGRYDEQYEDYFGRDAGDGSSVIIKIAVTVVVPLLIAYVVVLYFRRKMRSVFTAGSADRYVDENSLVLDEEWDRFSHITEVIIPKPDADGNKNSLGGGLGGGGTTIGSGGFSGHGGKF